MSNSINVSISIVQSIVQYKFHYLCKSSTFSTHVTFSREVERAIGPSRLSLSLTHTHVCSYTITVGTHIL